MGFQSGITRALGSIAAAGFGVARTLSEQKGAKAKQSVQESIKSKQTSNKKSTRNTIQEVVKSSTVSDKQPIKDLGKAQKQELTEKSIGEMNNGNEQ